MLHVGGTNTLVLTTKLSHTHVCGECNLRVIRRRPRGPIRCTIKFLLSLCYTLVVIHQCNTNGYAANGSGFECHQPDRKSVV